MNQNIDLRHLQAEVRVITAQTLMNSYNLRSSKWGEGLPEVKNPEAVIGALEKLIKKLFSDEIPPYIYIFILESNQGGQSSDINDCRYFIFIRDLAHDFNAEQKAYGVYMIYQPTLEVESASAITEDGVDWTLERLDSTKHEMRTKLLYGFLYQVLAQAKDFDKEKLPEGQLNLEALLAAGVNDELKEMLASEMESSKYAGEHVQEIPVKIDREYEEEDMQSEEQFGSEYVYVSAQSEVSSSRPNYAQSILEGMLDIEQDIEEEDTVEIDEETHEVFGDVNIEYQ